MHFLHWLVIGAAVGTLAALARRSRRREGWIDVAAAVVGAYIGGWLVQPMLRLAAAVGYGTFVERMPGALLALAGALFLLATVAMIRAGWHQPRENRP